jgi:hypothetical protein
MEQQLQKYALKDFELDLLVRELLLKTMIINPAIKHYLVIVQ